MKQQSLKKFIVVKYLLNQNLVDDVSDIILNLAIIKTNDNDILRWYSKIILFGIDSKFIAFKSPYIYKSNNFDPTRYLSRKDINLIIKNVLKCDEPDNIYVSIFVDLYISNLKWKIKLKLYTDILLIKSYDELGIDTRISYDNNTLLALISEVKKRLY